MPDDFDFDFDYEVPANDILPETGEATDAELLGNFSDNEEDAE